MRVLITGHEGYIGAVMAPMLRDEGFDVVGLDSGLFADCDFGSQPSGIPGIRRDLRDMTPAEVEGFDAVIHLAASLRKASRAVAISASRALRSCWNRSGSTKTCTSSTRTSPRRDWHE